MMKRCTNLVESNEKLTTFVKAVKRTLTRLDVPVSNVRVDVYKCLEVQIEARRKIKKKQVKRLIDKKRSVLVLRSRWEN